MNKNFKLKAKKVVSHILQKLLFLFLIWATSFCFKLMNYILYEFVIGTSLQTINKLVVIFLTGFPRFILLLLFLSVTIYLIPKIIKKSKEIAEKSFLKVLFELNAVLFLFYFFIYIMLWISGWEISIIRMSIQYEVPSISYINGLIIFILKD